MIEGRCLIPPSDISIHGPKNSDPKKERYAGFSGPFRKCERYFLHITVLRETLHRESTVKFMMDIAYHKLTLYIKKYSAHFNTIIFKNVLLPVLGIKFVDVLTLSDHF